MAFRSLLFVPGDRPERFDKAAASGADALILDLEDSVSAARKADARAAIAERLAHGTAGLPTFVRVNPLDGSYVADDLAALAGLRPDGLMLPKAEGAASVRTLLGLLAKNGLDGVAILPIATETPAAIFTLGSYGEVAQHLAGLTWGAEDLPAAIGATRSREDDGRLTPPYEVARALTLFGAHAAGCAAIETVFPAFQDDAGLARFAGLAARDGFAGMMAIHPRQIDAINRAFTPSDERIAWARQVIAAFAADPGAGALKLDGAMIDAPHRKQAERILRLAGAGGHRSD